MEESRVRPRRPPPPAHGSNQETLQGIQQFLELHHQAFTEVNNALSYDEEGKAAEALVCYKKGVQLMEEALAIALPHQMSSDMRSKRDKMASTLTNAKSRVQELGSPAHQGPVYGSSRQTALPTYDEAVSPVDESLPSDAVMYNADILLEICDAQVFFITADGYVSTPSYPSTLRICKFATQSVPGAPQHFLSIGRFTLPLVENLTPSLQTSPGSYVFPDITSTEEGAAVGILLDDKTSPEVIEAFESMLDNLSALRPANEGDNSEQATAATAAAATAYSYDTVQPPAAAATIQSYDTVQPPPRPDYTPSTDNNELEVASTEAPPPRMSTKIGHGLIVAADWVSWGLGKGAEKVGGLLAYGGEKLRKNMKPTSNEREVDDRYRQCLVVARNSSDRILQVTSKGVKLLGEATVALGKRAAPYIRTQAVKILPGKVTKPLASTDSSGRSKADDIMEVAGAGVKGFGVVYIGLEEAAKALGRALTSQTKATMSHRYGQQYGEATEHAMYAAGNTFLCAHNITQLGPKAIAKRAVKNTAKAVVTAPHPSSDRTQYHRQSVDGTDIHTLEITELPSEQHVVVTHTDSKT